jgi:NAD-dependent deacetylase
MSKLNLVVLSGAGISAESGLKTFRDNGGLWEGYDIYQVASPVGWASNPGLVLDFYNQRRRDVVLAEPNIAHRGIASLEHDFRVTVITQNIDDLHERAGSSSVIHLHGEIMKMRSSNDESLIYPVTGDIHLGDMGADGSQLRPHVVWFGEAVPMIEKAAEITSQADIFVIVGTSLNVYPAAGLIHMVKPASPVYVIDKIIPAINSGTNIYPIEKPATEGVSELIHILYADKDRES